MSNKLRIIEALIPHGTPSRNCIGGRTLEIGEADVKRATRYADRKANQLEAHMNELDIPVRCYGGNILHHDDGHVSIELNLIGKDGNHV